jgi:hypothetical protein
MILFPTSCIVRRFTRSIIRGAEKSEYEDSSIEADVQRSVMSSTPQPEGSRLRVELKAWSDYRFRTDDQLTGELADWIWRDGHWYKCVSCQRSNNTLLDHYVSEFERVSEAGYAEETSPPEGGIS